jgi:hypothetical protein
MAQRGGFLGGAGVQTTKPPRLGEIPGVNTGRGGEGIGRLPGEVAVIQPAIESILAPTRVLSAFRRPFSGHVYNLQTNEGWYVAENIVTHNCSLVLIPVLREGVV